jgi:hypothetical protein
VSPAPALATVTRPVCDGCARCGDITPGRLFARVGWAEWLCVHCWRAAGERGYRRSGLDVEVAATVQNLIAAQSAMLAHGGPEAYRVKSGRT